MIDLASIRSLADQEEEEDNEFGDVDDEFEEEDLPRPLAPRYRCAPI